MKKSMIAVAGLAAAMVALPAAAQMNMSAVYIGGSIGQSTMDEQCEGVTAGVSCDDKDTAWRILGGYQINRNFAAELGYHNLGEAKASAAGVEAKVKMSVWELVGVGMLPLGNQFSAYGKLGLIYGTAEGTSNVGISADESGMGWTWGLGGQFNVTRNLGLRLEFQQYKDVGGDEGGGDANVISLGAIWRFQ